MDERSPVCGPCSRADHESCVMWFPTGFMVQAPRTRSSGVRMVPEHAQCRCVCRDLDRGLDDRQRVS